MTTCTVRALTQLSPGIFELSFTPRNDFRYTAGQFVDVYLPETDTSATPERRWFTLSSSPTEDHLSITTKIGPNASRFKQLVSQLQPGDDIAISDAMGDFVLPMDKRRPLVFACAGIGVTPVRSMLKYLIDAHETRDIMVLAMETNPVSFCYKELLDTFNTHYYLTQTDASSPLTASEIAQKALSKEKPLIYLSGPEEWVEVVYGSLPADGVSPAQIVTDYFLGYTGESFIQ